MAQPVYAAHPLRAYLARAGEAARMPGGAHDFARDDGSESDDGGGADSDGDDAGPALRPRKRRRAIDGAAAALAGGTCAAAMAGRHALALVLLGGAGYPHVRARIHRAAHAVRHPPPPISNDGDRAVRETWTGLAATFDRTQAEVWAESCTLVSCAAFVCGLYELAAVVLAAALYPYLDVLLPRLQGVADRALLHLHDTLPPVPIYPAGGGSSVMLHVTSLRKEQCAHWAEACAILACMPVLFRVYSLSIAALAAALYPYLDAILPRTFRTANLCYVRLQALLPQVPEETITEWTTAIASFGQSLISSVSPHRIDRQRRQALAERFKYDVISSSLLATALSGPPSARGRGWHHAPGSRDVSVGPSEGVRAAVGSVAVLSNENSVRIALGLGAASLYAAALAHGLLALVLGAAAVYAYIDQDPPSVPQEGIVLALNDLEELTAASSRWDSVVQEALAHLEHDERSAPPTLRAALGTALTTTRTQCEQVRPLLAALGEPGPLADMYAPPSPVSPHFVRLQGDARARTTSLPAAAAAKRATWNGSYAALARAGSPTPAHRHASIQRRSELEPAWAPPPARAPVSPTALAGVADGAEEDGAPGSPDYFGAQAMRARKRRRAAGLSALGLEGLSASASLGPTTPPRGPRLSYSPSGTRLTALPPARHPLALPALRTALAGALGARRYACAHLLALRADEDGEYWADVRSVVALLTGSLADAGAHLAQALDAAAHARAEDGVPSRTPSWGAPAGDFAARPAGAGFAPVPSAPARFAVHADTIAGALDEARAHLAATCEALADVDPAAAAVRPQEAPALQAYEALRRALGAALRECERGRERLLDVLGADAPDAPEYDDMPQLAADGGSDRSSGDLGHVLRPRTPPPLLESGGGDASDDDDDDDAHAALLRAASALGLPPPGAELVYEAEPEPAPPRRARVAVPREERIKRMRAARIVAAETGSPRAGPGPWGPGGDVVQELKDVIWQVGERRRRRDGDGAELQTPLPPPRSR